MTLKLNVFQNKSGKILMGTLALPTSQADSFRLYLSTSSGGAFSPVKLFPNIPDKSLYPGNALVEVKRADLGVTTTASLFFKITSLKGGVESDLAESTVTTVPPEGAEAHDEMREDLTQAAQIHGYDAVKGLWERLETDSDGNLKTSTEITTNSAGLATEDKQDNQITQLQNLNSELSDHSTEPKQDVQIGHLSSIDSKTPTLGQKTSAGSSPVVLSSDQVPLTIQTSDSREIDSLGRFRISRTFVVFEAKFVINKQPLLYSESLSGGGTVVHNSVDPSVDVSVGTASGDQAIYQTREYFRYQPGKGMAVLYSFRFNPGKPGLRQRAGYFEANDGIFFELDGTDLFLVSRSSAGGVFSENRVPQSNWNIDKLDGTGPSGITLNPEAIQEGAIDFSWVAGGRVRVGFLLNGLVTYVHHFFHSNSELIPWVSRPSLPIRMEITNTASTSSPSTFKTYAQSVVSEGDVERVGISRSVTLQNNPRTTTGDTFFPLISIRLKQNSIRSVLLPLNVFLAANSAQNAIANVLLNANITGASWNSISPTSISEFDRSATAVSGGEVLNAFYFYTASAGGLTSTSAGNVAVSIASEIKVVADFAGNPDTLTLAVNRFSGNSGTAYGGGMTFKEVF